MTREGFLAMYQSITPTQQGCVLWPLAIGARGYCTTHYEGNITDAHLVSYKIFKGGVAFDRRLSNRCGRRNCVNPEHWEEVTMRESILRGTNPAAVNARKTHCKRGHPLPKPNRKSGYRVCNQCRRMNRWN